MVGAIKPILYESTETSFTTNGIGILNDVISCVVTQQRNGIYEAEIKYPMFGGIHFEEIKMRSIILVLPDNMSDPQPMRVYNITKPMRGIVTINCRHLAYDLMGIVAQPFTATSVTQAFVNMKTAAVTSCPFTFWTDKTTVGNLNITEPTAIWSILGGTEGSILDIYGSGEYEFDKFTIKLYQNRGYNRGVSIRYGKNLTDLKQEQNCESVYTGVYPFYVDQEEGVLELPEKVINASGTYNFTRIYALNLSDQWDEMPSVSDLRTRAQKYMTDNNIGVPKVSLDVEFISLEQTAEYKDLVLLEQVGLCDTVSVYFEEMNVTATAKVTEIRFDSILERYESIVLGDATSSLAHTIAAQGQSISSKPSETELRAAILSMTASILGANGGAVRLLDTDGDSYPDTLYIADNEDPALAQKVWRFNYEGWAASSTGIDGPYTLGATLNSGIVADFITAGTLSANLIKAGVLSDVAGKNYWNMQTGEFALASTITVGGSTVPAIAAAEANSVTSSAISTYDSGLNQTKIFNKLTNNGQTQGIYLSNGKIYINGSYINTYYLTTNTAQLTGRMTVYNGNAAGGYIGFMNGADDYGLTDGIAIVDNTKHNYFIATNSGWRASSYETSTMKSEVYGFVNDDTGGSQISLLTARTSASNVSFYTTKVYVDQNLEVHGTKNRVVDTDNYLNRLLYSYEMAAPMFGDIGEGTIDDTGECLIDLDDIFSEAINSDVEYQVFLQKEGQGDLWVSYKSHLYFIVSGTPGLKFAWEIKVKQKGYEFSRLDETEIPSAEPSDDEGTASPEDIDYSYYEELYSDEIPDFESIYSEELAG